MAHLLCGPVAFHILRCASCSPLFPGPHPLPCGCLQVSQHPECDIELLVLPETSSKEHKVKLVQVVAKVPVGNQATSR